MWALVRATARGVGTTGVAASPEVIERTAIARAGAGTTGGSGVRDKVRHGAAVQPCRLHVVQRKA